jgi:hypothetical protein
MSDLSPSQAACHAAIEKLAKAISNINLLAKYETADSLETILNTAHDDVLSVTGRLSQISAFADEARAKRLKAFG